MHDNARQGSATASAPVSVPVSSVGSVDYGGLEFADRDSETSNSPRPSPSYITPRAAGTGTGTGAGITTITGVELPAGPSQSF
jgi:hypothetical protein